MQKKHIFKLEVTFETDDTEDIGKIADQVLANSLGMGTILGCEIMGKVVWMTLGDDGYTEKTQDFDNKEQLEQLEQMKQQKQYGQYDDVEVDDEDLE